MAVILLYWEDRTYHHALEELLRRAGYDVISTDDGGYALQVLQRIDVDLLMLEVATEEAPALPLLELVRHGPAADVPAIVLSDFNDASLVHAARDLGADDFLVKKRSLLTELLGRVDQHVSPHRAWHPAPIVFEAPRLHYRGT